jgi:hypothetical protein
MENAHLTQVSWMVPAGIGSFSELGICVGRNCNGRAIDRYTIGQRLVNNRGTQQIL